MYLYKICHVNYKPRPDLFPSDLEAVCVQINQANAQSFIILSFYKLPCSINDVFTNIENLIKLIDDESKVKNFTFLEI